MQGLVAIVLLLCCVNVSGLMLSKLAPETHATGAQGRAHGKLVVAFVQLLFPGQSALGRFVRSADNLGIDTVRSGSGFDLLTLTVVGLVLTLVVLAASFWPARRAASVDPVTAMRAD